MNPEAIILKCDLCPGDLVTLTAAVRDLQTAHRGRFRVDVRTNHPALWENNPHITPIADGAGRVIEMEYPLIHESNQGQHHFIHGYRKHLEDKLQLTIPAGAFKGDIHLTEEERNAEPILPRYWLIVAGGKLDFTAKWWDIRRWQEVVDALKGKVQFVQVGHRNDVHPPLKGVKNLTGKTSLRDLVNLVYHAEGVVCPVTAIMHLAAAVPTKTDRLRPCVVVAGGREPSHWEAYPGHTYLDTIGQLGCCATGGCWKSRVVALGDADEKDQSLCSYPVEIREGVHLPACLDLITPPMVVHAVVAYLRFADLIPGEPIAACAPCNATVLVPKPRGLPADRKVWGPQKWREFHGRAVNRLDVDKGTELVWLAKFTMSLPCEECRLHFVTFLLLHPPELQSVDVYRWWGIAAHNYVNVAIGAKPLSIEEAERSIDYNRNRTHAETHARTQTCVICPDLVRPTATEGARCGRTDEVLRLKLAGGTCDRWPDYAPPRAVAASAPGEIGLVIGTYGAVPYIHLQLESVRRFHPGMKVLVVDDCSPDAEALRKICAEYGAELHVNEKRMGHVPGDMQAFVTGHEWANRNGIGLLVKFSRRWIPTAAWAGDLLELWKESAAPTLCNRCIHNGFGFRSECLAMDTRAWRETDALAHIREQIIRALPLGPEVTAPHQHWFLVEGIIHHAAGVAMRAGTRKWQDYYRENPPLPQCEGYARWPWMSESRNQHIAGVLWHEINRATDYVQKLNEWGISEYTTAQFISPSGNIHR